jgi:hypothetical protein
MNLLSCIKRTLASSIFCLFFFDFFSFSYWGFTFTSWSFVLVWKKCELYFFFICFNGRYFPQLIEMVRIFDT